MFTGYNKNVCCAINVQDELLDAESEQRSLWGCDLMKPGGHIGIRNTDLLESQMHRQLLTIKLQNIL